MALAPSSFKNFEVRTMSAKQLSVPLEWKHKVVNNLCDPHFTWESFCNKHLPAEPPQNWIEGRSAEDNRFRGNLDRLIKKQCAVSDATLSITKHIILRHFRLPNHLTSDSKFRSNCRTKRDKYETLFSWCMTTSSILYSV